MVMGMQDSGGSSDRAQLVLVGSIAVAFIIIGLVVVFNTVLFTDNLAARASVEEVEDASELQQHVDREAPELVRHVENGTETNDVLHDNVDENVSTTYNRLLAETHADTGTVYVNVTYNASASTNGTRVVQDDETDFENASSAQDWSPVNSPRNVSEFVMEVNSSLDNILNDNFTATVQNGTGETISLEMTSATNELTLKQYRNGGLQTTCTVTTTDETAIVNVSDGVVIGDTTCSFDSLDILDGPYTISYENGTQMEGNYSFLVNGTIDASADSRYEGRNGPDTPYVNHVLLEAGVEIYYQSRTVTYESNQTVTVREAPQ